MIIPWHVHIHNIHPQIYTPRAASLSCPPGRTIGRRRPLKCGMAETYGEGTRTCAVLCDDGDTMCCHTRLRIYYHSTSRAGGGGPASPGPAAPPCVSASPSVPTPRPPQPPPQAGRKTGRHGNTYRGQNQGDDHCHRIRTAAQ
jgi:hypothetical protein